MSRWSGAVTTARTTARRATSPCCRGWGTRHPFTGLGYDNTTKIMKQLGAKKSAAIAYGASPSSTASAKTTQDYAGPAQGLKPVYTNTSVDFGSTDVGPIVLGIKNSGADAAYLPLVASSDFAILQGLAAERRQDEGEPHATGYGQDLLDSPIASIIGPNTVLFQTYKPVEIGDKATKQFQADLKKARRHRRTRLRGLHRIHHVRHGGDRARAGGQDAHPQGLRRRLPQPGHLGPGGPGLPARAGRSRLVRQVPRQAAASTP